MDALDDPNVSKVASSSSSSAAAPICRCCFAILFSIFALFFYLLFTIGFFVALIEIFYISNPPSLPAHCKIVSTGVDLRSTKVCDLGLLNQRAKHLLYPFEKARFGCRYDYYWASIFKVEYKEHSSGQTFHALAEAPKEALPIDCRPNFGTAWLTKDKFKVNETYNCRYTPGITKVDIYSDDLFNCQAKDPSSVEMMRRYSIVVERIINYFISKKGRAGLAMRESLAGVVVGMLTAFLGASFVKLLLMPTSLLTRSWKEMKLSFSVLIVRLTRVCFIVAYLCSIGWLIFQYLKWLGLPDIFSLAFSSLY